uniref:Uncharacterized protein n=1 Tax=Meloidogyne enterolobii TaxID=390850 RepID=A0A6V7USH5_MELEN|nr:unnamed protein product [Meloidogyne enterolobii]
MNKEYKDIIFYLTEAVVYYINVRNRVSSLDGERIREFDERTMEEHGVIDYLKILRSLPTIKLIAGEIDFEWDVNRKLGIVIPKWIEILEDMINEVKNDLESIEGISSINKMQFESLQINYLEWLIGYSSIVRNYLCQSNEEDVKKLKTNIAQMFGNEMLLKLEITQPNALSIRPFNGRFNKNLSL